MLGHQEREIVSEPSLDFTQFLCARLNLDPPDTLALLGSFLLSFEPGRLIPRCEPPTHFHQGE
jgi:hypothetical protein